MPPKKFYKRRYYPKKNYRKKSTNARRMMGHRGRNYLSTIRSVMKWANLARNMINCEKKYRDVAVNSNPSSVSTLSVLLNGLAEGDDTQNRNGRSVLADSLHVRWTSKLGNAATNTMLKFVIVCDKKPDITTPTSWAQVYGGNEINGQIDKQNEGDRFVILKQHMVRLNDGTGRSASGDIYLSLKGVHIKYDGTGSTGTVDLESNAIYIIAISDEPTNAPIFNFVSRFSFYDN